MHTTHPWPLVGKQDPLSLVDARLQVHHAAQMVVSLAISFLPSRSDDSHTNLEWLPGRALAGRLIQGNSRFRGALRFDPLVLMMLDETDNVLDEYRLAGRTASQAVQWLTAALGEAGVDPTRLTSRKHYEIPGHPVAEGAPFGSDGPAAGELSGYYEGAHQALSQLVANRTDASEIRCWPHHFDLATLITAGPGRTIGLGLSPGDESYSEPYYYVTPYPYPRGPLPQLSHGFWNPSGWVGAVLPGSHLARVEDPDAQRMLVHTYLKTSLAVCEGLL